MDLLITYDVSTETEGGQRRLRKVAQACQSFGQRVQKSVFECAVDEMNREKLLDKLLNIIDKESDSLRIYRLKEPREQYIEVYGLDHYTDFKKPLVA